MSPLVHDLVRIDPTRVAFRDAPAWVAASLACAPWLVVRRAHIAGRIAVGVRGPRRDQRFACVIDAIDVRAHLTPAAVLQRAAQHRDRFATALQHIAKGAPPRMPPWGPGGSYGFELAAEITTVTAASDLDIIVRPAEIDRALLLAFHRSCSDAAALLALRIDVLIETPYAGMSLAEIIADEPSVIAKTPAGPQLVACP